MKLILFLSISKYPLGFAKYLFNALKYPKTKKTKMYAYN